MTKVPKNYFFGLKCLKFGVLILTDGDAISPLPLTPPWSSCVMACPPIDNMGLRLPRPSSLHLVMDRQNCATACLRRGAWREGVMAAVPSPRQEASAERQMELGHGDRSPIGPMGP